MDIQITVKSIGQKASRLKIERLSLPDLGADATLRELLSALVAQQVAAYNQRHIGLDDRDQTQAPLNDYLAVLAQTGKAGFGLRYNDQQADIKTAQANALQSFEDGLFAVFVDETEIDSLDTKLTLSQDTIISLIRLTFLAGGYW